MIVLQCIHLHFGNDLKTTAPCNIALKLRLPTEHRIISQSERVINISSIANSISHFNGDIELQISYYGFEKI